MNYYNEFDPYAAQWLRNLIDAGHIAPGIVDERSITDVKPADLEGYTQCHFFAGIGVWSHALRQSGWPDSRPVWTGSCPCQPFSAAGNGGGVTDKRHLWPTWFNLIRECRPGVIFGEQVEAAINHGWLDLVQTDLEGEDYACGAVGLPAGGVGAPHIRQRLWFVGHAASLRQCGRVKDTHGLKPEMLGAGHKSIFGGLANADSGRYDGRASTTGQQAGASTWLANGSTSGELADAANNGYLAANGLRETVKPSGEAGTHGVGQLAGSCDVSQLADATQGRWAWVGGSSGTQEQRTAQCSASSFWSDCNWLPCRDGKARPVEPGTFPLAHGSTARVGRLRAYGNAIVPQVAQAFIEAYLES